MTAKTQLYGGAAVALVVAAGLGFGLARVTTPAPPAPAAPPAAAEAGQADTVALDSEAIAAAGIGVEAAAAGQPGGEIQAQAAVTAAADGQAVLTARAGGAVTRIFKRLGDPVRAGETVAVVESRDAAAIAAERTAASAKAALARTVLAREQRLYDQKVSPRQDLETARAEAVSADAEVGRTRAAAGAARLAPDGRSVLVSSPIAGRVVAAAASLGAFVQPDVELFRVADPRRIQVEAAVAAADVSRIALGDAATIDTPTGPVAATVRAIAPGLDAQTRAATAVLIPTIESAGLQPGQLVAVRIRPRGAAGAAGGVSLPEEAVQTVNGRPSVFVRTPTGFRVQPVTVGARGGGRVAVAAGLTAGQVVASRNAFLLKAELGKSGAEE